MIVAGFCKMDVVDEITIQKRYRIRRRQKQSDDGDTMIRQQDNDDTIQRYKDDDHTRRMVPIIWEYYYYMTIKWEEA